MRYELVIFDNDGVLVDSEPLANTVLSGYLTELGHPTSYEESLRDYMGSAVHRVHDLVEERTGQKLPEDFDTTLSTRTFAAFEQELVAVEGAEELLGKLVADGVDYCVASSGSHERIRVGHRKTGIDQWFEEEWIFSSEDVGQGKAGPGPVPARRRAHGRRAGAVRRHRGQPARRGSGTGGRDGRVRVHLDGARRPARRSDRALLGHGPAAPTARLKPLLRSSPARKLLG